MLTLFSIPKPFVGHIATIQQNAIMSWKRLRPAPEIILFGDEEGTAQVATELCCRHVPEVACNESGIPLVSDVFHQAQSLAANNLLAYVNADIILLSDFMRAAQRLASWRDRFLMVGRRWDIDLPQSVDYDQPAWEASLRALVLERARRRIPEAVDYFLFSRGLYRDVLPFTIGRLWWDHWLVWKACSLRVAVVDASAAVLAIHQNHDYSHHPQGGTGIWQGEEARHNHKLAGGRGHLYTIGDAAFRLTGDRIQANLMHRLAPTRRAIRRAWRPVYYRVCIPVWLAFLNSTRPIRRPLGLSQESISNMWDKLKLERRR